MTQHHENYHLLNLIGYGLAKFDMVFVNHFGFETKQAFFEYCIEINLAETVGVVKNRQDLFDPFFENNRKGWWQKGDAYLHRKEFIEATFKQETLDAGKFAELVKLYLESDLSIIAPKESVIPPILRSKFRQLQETGQEAELFFMNNYQQIDFLKNGELEDARLFGDGYDFQIGIGKHFFLAEIKGIRGTKGSIRFTENEHTKAIEFRNNYVLIVVNNLEKSPKMEIIRNPTMKLTFSPKTLKTQQLFFQSKVLDWANL